MKLLKKSKRRALYRIAKNDITEIYQYCLFTKYLHTVRVKVFTCLGRFNMSIDADNWYGKDFIRAMAQFAKG